MNHSTFFKCCQKCQTRYLYQTTIVSQTFVQVKIFWNKVKIKNQELLLGMIKKTKGHLKYIKLW